MNYRTFASWLRWLTAAFVLMTIWSSAVAADDLLLKNADVFDGERVMPRTSVLVVDGMIRQVGESLERDGATFGIQFPTLSLDMLQASIQAAHDRDKLAVAHIGSLQGAKDALGADVDGLVHIFGDRQADRELLDIANQRKRFVVPTAAVMCALVQKDATQQVESDERLRPFLSPQNLGSLQRRFPRRQEIKLEFHNVLHNIKALADAGVTILAGADVIMAWLMFS